MVPTAQALDDKDTVQVMLNQENWNFGTILKKTMISDTNMTSVSDRYNHKLSYIVLLQFLTAMSKLRSNKFFLFILSDFPIPILVFSFDPLKCIEGQEIES